jgi:hypothetical protein
MLSPHPYWISMAQGPHLISGIVVDAAEHPVRSARVYFTNTPIAIPDIAALSDAEGRFTLSVPAEGAYTIESSAEGHGPGRATVDVAGDGGTVRIQLT